MSPLAQTALTLACMVASFYVGKKSGLTHGIRYIFSFMTDKEIEKVVMKIEKETKFR